MGDLKKRIKKGVTAIDPTVKDDGYLDFLIEDIINRALLYTNRLQLPEDERVPAELETTLARMVQQVHRTVQEQVEAESKSVEKLQDGQQQIWYGEHMASFLSSASDEGIFMSGKEILDKLRLVTVVEDEY